MKTGIRSIEAFLLLAETESFSLAARRFGLSQPAFSLAIQRLEDGMGVRLFRRTSRRVALSAEGEAFVPKAQALLRMWQTAFEEMSDLAAARRGRVAVAALPSVAASLLPGVMRRFAASHPEVRVEIHDVLHDEVLALVHSGRVDMGISVAPRRTDEASFAALLADKFVAILPRDHPLAERDRITWSALNREPMVSMTSTTSVRQLTDFTLAEMRQSARFVCEANHLATVACMVASGMGVSALPALCLPVILRPDLVWRPLEEPVAERGLGLISREAGELSVAARTFLGALRDIEASDAFAAFPGQIRLAEAPAPSV